MSAGTWKVVIEAWPYFGTKQEEVSPRSRVFSIQASDFEDAVRQARGIQIGIKSDDRVWEAPIMSVVFTSSLTGGYAQPVAPPRPGSER